jgi:hypothetical protein
MTLLCSSFVILNVTRFPGSGSQLDGKYYERSLGSPSAMIQCRVEDPGRSA